MSEVHTIGLDLAKSAFQAHGASVTGNLASPVMGTCAGFQRNQTSWLT